MSGCAGLFGYTHTATYSLSLDEVSRPAVTKDRWGDVENIQLSDSSKYEYADDLVDVLIGATTDGIAFHMQNKTEHTIKVVWDEAAFIDTDGSAGRVMHYGVRFMDRNNSQPPSILPGHGTITDEAFPTDRVYYGTEWANLPLIRPSTVVSQSPGASPDVVKFQRDADNNVGKRIGLLLPLEVEGVVNEYTFWFKVDSVQFTPPSGS